MNKLLLLLFILVIGICGCTSYNYRSPVIKERLANNDYDGALNEIAQISSDTSKLLYLYERGLVHHYNNEYEESNTCLEQAEFLLEELYTKSLTREIGAFFTSDNVTKYRGERFEAAYIHYYKILNYLLIDKLDAAVIECRKLNYKLQLFSDHDNSFYRNDPFLQYLTGMVYFAGGEYIDAEVSFRAALESYATLSEEYRVEPPPFLSCDFKDLLWRDVDTSESDRYKLDEHCPFIDKNHGETGIVNIFFECGYVPYKVTVDVLLPIFEGEISDDFDKDEYAGVLVDRYGAEEDGTRKVEYWLKVSIPSMRAEPSTIQKIDIHVSGRDDKATSTYLVEDIEIIAFQSFDQRMGSILLKTTLRALTKYLVKKGIEKETNEVVGWFANLFNVATEVADTRSWSTLPGKIFMSRLELPEGEYDIQVELYADTGKESFSLKNISVRKYQNTFLNYRIY